MSTLQRTPFRRSSIGTRRMALLMIGLAGVVAGYQVSDNGAGAMAQSRDRTSVQALASLTGVVEAARPFRAAQVYLRNLDTRMLYMVYSNAGPFKAVALLPGEYEINVQAKGLESDVQKLTIKAGDRPHVKLSMREASDPDRFPSAVPPPRRELTLQSYDEVYPDGPGKQVMEEVCMACHGENFFPMRPRNAAGWQAGLDLMMGKGNFDGDRVNSYAGILAPPATNFRFGYQDRKDLLEYLIKNFGADSIPRAVRPDKEMPLDEAKLGKAQYIEYYLAPSSSNRETAAGQRRASSPNRATESSIPCSSTRRQCMGRRSRLSESAGLARSAHGSAEGLRPARSAGRRSRAGHRSRRDHLGPGAGGRAPHEGVPPSRIQSGDRAVAAPDQCRSGRRHPQSQQSRYACVRRRLQGQSLHELVRAGSDRPVRSTNWKGRRLPHPDEFRDSVRDGRRPQRQHLVRPLELRQARQVRHDQRAMDGIHAADISGQHAARRGDRFEEQRVVRTQTFTFCPKPQVGADSPKLQHGADGSVWYTARTGTRGATGFGVLYPDIDRITALGGYPLNGAPGYAFRTER